MRIGISLNSSVAAPDPLTSVAWLVERTRAAHGAGLSSLTVGDHHARTRSYLQNTPLLGRLLAEWTGRPAGCLFLLPLWPPVLVAEHVGTLAAMLDAPFIVQTGIGAGEQQFAAFDANLRTRGRDLEHHIDRVRALLADRAEDGVRVTPRPHRAVEWWIGAGSAPVALRRAARLGDAWYAPPALRPADAGGPLSVYLEACDELGVTPRPIVRQDIVVTADGIEAQRLADDRIAAGYRGMTRDQVAAGSPDQVAERFGAFGELGFTDVIVRCMDVDQVTAVETIEALAEVQRLLD